MPDQTCRHCGAIHGVKCPWVKALEYYPDGTLKRVEFHAPAPLVQTYPLQPPAVDPLTQPHRFQWHPNTSVSEQIILESTAGAGTSGKSAVLAPRDGEAQP